MQDFFYELPAEKIATHPLENRSDAKLLLWTNNHISESTFQHLNQFIPEGYSIVFNNTRVIRARLFFQNSNGAMIEVFLLEPLLPHKDVQLVFEAKQTCTWLCYVSKPEKWREEKLTAVFGNGLFAQKLSAKKIERLHDGFVIKLEWEPAENSFAQVLETAGHIPLPPYIKRKDTADDINRYQTVFSLHNGSVAAPTASLHFSEQMMRELEKNKTETAFVTLHVGAGTFKPVKTDEVKQHVMHAETIVVDKATVEKFCNENKFGKIIAAGTTSLRTLESLYWFGIKILEGHQTGDIFFMDQWFPYQHHQEFTRQQSMLALLEYMNDHHIQQIEGQTQLMIVPGYDFKMVKGLITNFHQPHSTLLLLVAAFAGTHWRNIYDHALQNNFRFLSYGDGSLLLK